MQTACHYLALGNAEQSPPTGATFRNAFNSSFVCTLICVFISSSRVCLAAGYTCVMQALCQTCRVYRSAGEHQGPTAWGMDRVRDIALERQYTGNRIQGSNPCLSASFPPINRHFRPSLRSPERYRRLVAKVLFWAIQCVSLDTYLTLGLADREPAVRLA